MSLSAIHPLPLASQSFQSRFSCSPGPGNWLTNNLSSIHHKKLPTDEVSLPTLGLLDELETREYCSLEYSPNLEVLEKPL